MEKQVFNPLIAIELEMQAEKVEEELYKKLEKKLGNDITEVIKANIGDSQALGQQPITFARQLLALVTLPELLDDPRYPSDVKRRAKDILNGCTNGSIGSYTHFLGVDIIRKQVAKYIETRDSGIPCNWENIFLCNGATEGVMNLLGTFINSSESKRVGVMVPIPQYPLYSFLIEKYNMYQIEYYLDESKSWSINVPEMRHAVNEAKKYCCPQILVIINPGNPTGHVLTRKNIEDIIKFAYEEKLFIFADEVYQHNIYAENKEFHSLKKVMCEMGPPYSKMGLASFMSCSKGYMAECGIRGGYCEVINLEPAIKTKLLASLFASLCPNVSGQVVMYAIVHPPEPGEPSYETFIKEKKNILTSLAERAKMVVETLNSLDGISCSEIQGSMYAMPRIKLPQKAIEKAKSLDLDPDVFYTSELLKKKHVCVVPGIGFGQKLGTYHFRTTILPQPDKLKTMLQDIRDFHIKFVNEYM